MIDGRDGSGFPKKSLPRPRVLRQRPFQHLDRYPSAETHLFGHVYGTHTAAPQGTQNVKVRVYLQELLKAHFAHGAPPLCYLGGRYHGQSISIRMRTSRAAETGARTWCPIVVLHC